jgi:hypothetical protein
MRRNGANKAGWFAKSDTLRDKLGRTFIRIRALNENVLKSTEK